MDLFQAIAAQYDVSCIADTEEDELMALLKAEIGEEHAAMYKMQFQLSLHFGGDDKAFVVDLDYVWPWLGYTKKCTAYRALSTTFTKNLDYIEQTREEYIQDHGSAVRHTVNGGLNKKYILLNFASYKVFCISADTPKAAENRLYMCKVESVVHLHRKMILDQSILHGITICKEFDDKTRANADKLLTVTKESIYKCERSRHVALIEANRNISLVYALRILEFPDNSFILKVGFTKNDLIERVKAASKKFGCDALVIDVFRCTNSDELEKAVFGLPQFSSKRYHEKINDESSIEIFHVKDRFVYNNLKNLIKKEVKDPKYHRNTENQLQMLVAQNQERLIDERAMIFEMFKDDKDGLLKMMSLIKT